MSIICPGKGVTFEPKVNQANGQNHVIEVFHRGGRRRTNAKFFKVQENGIKITNNAPRNGSGRGSNQVVPKGSPSSMIN